MTEPLYSGKAKSVYPGENADELVMVFRDDASAFDGAKRASLARKGAVNNHFNAFVMNRLTEAGVANHFLRLDGPDRAIVRRLEMLPVECVIRNYAAGSLCKRLGIEEGRALEPPVFEFFLKDDALHDPLINQSHILSFGWARPEEIEAMERLTRQVNEVLKPLFETAGLRLVDYKLEFGRYQGELMLGDEFTPDGCRVWDMTTGEKLDKDRFRQDLGDVVAGYEAIAQRLGIPLDTGDPS